MYSYMSDINVPNFSLAQHRMFLTNLNFLERKKTSLVHNLGNELYM